MRDFSLDNSVVTMSDMSSLILQQIDMLFDTSYGEVLGEPDYGTDFRQYLWDMRASAEDISNYTRSAIAANVMLFGWDCEVSTSLMEGVNNDIILVTITLRNGNDSIEKTYKVQ